MLELYHFPGSVCSQRVRLVLAELGIQWTGKVVDILRGEQFKPEYLALNPNAVVPTLVHDGHAIIESSVISEYLQDIAPSADLRPSAPWLRAEMRMWAKHVDEGLHQAIGTLTGGAKNELLRQQIISSGETIENYLAQIPDESRRARQLAGLKQEPGSQVFANAIRHCMKIAEKMNSALSNAPFLAGERYSLADSAMTPYLLRLERLSMVEIFNRHDNVVRWYALMKERPSFVTAVSAFDTAPVIEMLRHGGERIWRAARDTAIKGS
ncbi:MAG: glutathione S-transferase family protein [Rhizobiales bacterium]|nr:glutathione S-transferase family protein [Hyphomicrobiales bacterium]